MRYWLTFGLISALAIFLMSPTGDAGVCGDSDGDGQGSCGGTLDNCTLLANANGNTSPGSNCGNQEDGDMDGYGNTCDSDFNNNGATDLVDVSIVLAAAAIVSTSPVTDLSCSGAVSLVDVSRTLAEAALVIVPGPSEYPCAGTIPCP